MYTFQVQWLMNFLADIGGFSIDVHSPFLASILTLGVGIEYCHFQRVTQSAMEGNSPSLSGKTTFRKQAMSTDTI